MHRGILLLLSAICCSTGYFPTSGNLRISDIIPDETTDAGKQEAPDVSCSTTSKNFSKEPSVNNVMPGNLDYRWFNPAFVRKEIINAAKRDEREICDCYTIRDAPMNEKADDKCYSTGMLDQIPKKIDLAVDFLLKK